MVDSHSGLAGIAHWINSYYRLPDEDKVDKKDEVVAKIKAMVDAEYAVGRNTVMGDSELEEMFIEADPIREKLCAHHLHLTDR